MGKKMLFLLYCTLHTLVSTGQTQNMVSNPSFEEVWEYPFTMNQLKLTKGWFPFGTADPSPDFFHAACFNDAMSVPKNLFGKQMAHSGEAYVGLITYLTSKSGRGWQIPINHREFAMTSLSKPLLAGHEYYAEMYVNLADNCEFSIDNIGMYFTKDMPSFDWKVMNFNHYKAQISSPKGVSLDNNEGWTKISGTFIAEGDEMTLCVGTFAPDSALMITKTKRKFSHQRDKRTPKNLQPQISYYFIDDILVAPVDNSESIYPPQKPLIALENESPFGPIEVGKKITLQNIYFEFDQATLLGNSYFELNKLLSFMESNERVKIQINGHTDNIGSRAYNLDLSTDRAKAVADFLIMKGINEFRVEHKGYGSNEPIVPNSSLQNQALNRRVELEIIGK